MKFTISREKFLQPLQLVSGAVERRHTLPILSNVLIKVSEDALWLTGTDLEVELIASTRLEGEYEEGEITVPAKKLFDICRGIADGTDIQFSLDGSKALIRAGRGRYTLSTLSASDYPNLEDWEGEVEFELSSADIKRLINSTHFSMAQQDVRYYLNGMSLETEEHIIRTVATDGHRLALCRLDYESASLPARQVIIPRKGVLEISRLIGDDEKSIKVQIGANHIRLFSSDFIFTSKLVDGRFPDYRRVLPKDGDKTILASKAVLKDAFARAAILSNEKFRGVRLNLSSGELKITANNPEQEEAEEIVDVNYEGDDLEIGFNVAYLIDVLNALTTEEVQLTLSDSNSSALIQNAGDDAALYVIMPMRL
ncbi:DNA polymerase III subunit beta [Alteromonas sp. RKMC-009]|uniref:DNA polymerase III subunit beta n=1 Tax=Alteromonas sp. RKMC-009 TaxID=2267264 RepID=UPI000C64479C|nr:DNA polymerase III subunit beta [Alteromonas sp. RKMC-009]AYA62529.1 DNA polymerase III subunit beta [Alteromonas sp. RKMC-009]MBT79889.1 DNA polymerase III subunit beta [Alteromonadaceae bacterium]